MCAGAAKVSQRLCAASEAAIRRGDRAEEPVISVAPIQTGRKKTHHVAAEDLIRLKADGTSEDWGT